MTTPPSQYLYHDVPYHPPEADSFAEKLLEKLRLLSTIQENVESSIGDLDFNWEGRKKDAFMYESNPHRRKIAEQMGNLQNQERFFRMIKVMRREQYLNPEWEAYQRGNR